MYRNRAGSVIVTVSVSHSSDQLGPSVVRGTGNCDFTSQFGKHSCQSLVK